MPYLNRVKMLLSGTPGVGTMTLGAVLPPYQSVSQAGGVDGGVYSYAIEEGADKFECGRGTYSSGTFSRDEVFDSSAGYGVKASFTSAAIFVVTLLSQDISVIEQKAAASASSRDLARHALAIAELRGTRLPGSAGWTDSFGDTTGVDAAASSNEIYDATDELYSNSAPAGSYWNRNDAGSVSIGNDDLRGIATNGSFYIVVGMNGRILKSSGLNLSSWSVKQTGLPSLNDLIYSSRLGLFFAIGLTGTIRVSSDGETWTTPIGNPFGSVNMYAVTESPTRVYFGGAGGVVYYTEDGVNFYQNSSSLGSDIAALSFGGGVLIAASRTASQIARLVESTGVWANVTIPGSTQAAFLSNSAAHNGSFFVTSSHNQTRRSTDGTSWELLSIPAANLSSIRGVFWTGSLWLLAGAGPSGAVVYSSDATSWATATHDGGGYGGGSAVTFTTLNGLMVSAGQSGYIYSSTPPLAAMDLRSVAGALTSVPNTANMTVIAKGASAITPGTHLTGYVSRDNGANWQTMSLAAAETYSDGFTVFEAYGVPLSSQPSGSNLRWRATTTAAFSVEITGVHVSTGA